MTQTLRSTLAALDALSQNRATLEEKIKGTKDSDNVLPELLKCGQDGVDGVFATHLSRYDGVKAEVAQNVARQQELLGVIASNMAAFKQVYDVDGWQSEINRVAGAKLDCSVWLGRMSPCWQSVIDIFLLSGL